MRQQVNEITGINEGFLPATIHAVPTEFPRTNSNGTKFGIVTVNVEYPDGSKDDVNAIMYELSAATKLFKDGGRVELRVQLEGEWAGNAVVQLPAAKRVDITKFGIGAPAGKVAVNA